MRSSKAQSDAGSDRVWVPREPDANQLTFTPHNALSGSNHKGPEGRPRAPSDARTNATANSTKTWSEYYPPSQVASSRPQNNQAGSRATSGQQFEHIRAYKEDARTRAANQLHRQAIRSEEEAEDPVAEEDEDDDDEDPY